MDSDNNDDNLSESYLVKPTPIELFYDNEIDNLIDLFDDLKDRFYYLFGTRSEKFTKFLIENIFEVNSKSISTWNKSIRYIKVDNKFIEEFNYEINIALNIINKYLESKKYIKKKINIHCLIEFCYLHRFN